MFTRRKLIALALMAAGMISAGPLAETSVAQGGCTLTRGAGLGNWDLPPAGPGSLGAIDGDLFLNGMAVYHMTGVIMEEGLACPSCRGGTFFGTLDDGIGIGPDYTVSGTWFGDFFSGQGTWQGTIFKDVGPAKIPVGRMRGIYKDPMAVPDPIGTFAARWVLCD
jgi:hypothetical protein